MSRPVTTWQVAELLGEAYGRAATVGIARSGFRASGLWHLDINVFCDADFSAAAFTDVAVLPSVTTTIVNRLLNSIRLLLSILL